MTKPDGWHDSEQRIKGFFDVIDRKPWVSPYAVPRKRKARSVVQARKTPYMRGVWEVLDPPPAVRTAQKVYDLDMACLRVRRAGATYRTISSKLGTNGPERARQRVARAERRKGREPPVVEWMNGDGEDAIKAMARWLLRKRLVTPRRA